MLKETKETVVFSVIFLSLVAFQFGMGQCPLPPWLCLWYNRWLRLITMLLPGPDLHCVGRWHLGDFRNISCRSENQNEVLPFERGTPGTEPHGKSGPGYCITFIQRLDEDLW